MIFVSIHIFPNSLKRSFCKRWSITVYVFDVVLIEGCFDQKLTMRKITDLGIFLAR